MLYTFGFERIGVVVGDLYFVDPDPSPGQEGPERGVRLEVRLLERVPLEGSVYSAQPIRIDRPVWRADLLESVGSPPGSFDRTHHHPRFVGWEPGGRTFEPAMSAEPLRFVGDQLRQLPALLERAGIAPDSVGPDDAAELAGAADEIVATTARLLQRVHAGELATGPAEGLDSPAGVRAGWL